MPITADDVLQKRKEYKRCKREWKYDRAKGVPVAVCVEEAAAPVKKTRKPRDPNRPRSDKEKANDERLKRQTALAKEIRAANAGMEWQDAIKAAAAQMKAAK